MKSKEEIIREAYGSKYDLLKDNINSNGWINENVTTRSIFDSLEFDTKTNSMRPLSLKGIENNNGWIKIETEDDLPKENKSYWIIMNGKINVGKYQTDFKKWLVKEHQYFETYTAIGISNYQKIIKPNPPIY